MSGFLVGLDNALVKIDTTEHKGQNPDYRYKIVIVSIISRNALFHLAWLWLADLF